MNYQETIEFLYNQLPMYQRIGKAAYKADLNTTIKLDNYFNNPHKNYRTIHIAGTNGKGSVAHSIASVLQEQGLKVGLYTSPHYLDFRERIKINGQMVSKDFIVDFVKDHSSFFATLKPSFFEITVAMAFEYFHKQKVDIAIIEVGMGGRLDSTNIIKPILSIITNIGFDHTQFLGNKLSQIAQEKAEIIKKDIPVVVGEKKTEIKSVFSTKAQYVDAPLYFSSHNFSIQQSFIDSNNQNTGIMGRWQTLSKNPLVICDAGHNIDGISMVIRQLNSLNFDNLHIILGTVNDKDLSKILKVLPINAQYYFTKANISRALNEQSLQNSASNFDLTGKSFKNVSTAIENALKNYKKSDLIFIGGSTFIVAEAIEFFTNKSDN